jgi:hypothetical protein
MKNLKLPPAIRRLVDEEHIRNNPELKGNYGPLDYILHEGYSLKLVETDSTFSLFAEINIDFDRMLNLVEYLIIIIPNEEVSVIIGHRDDEPTFLPYISKHRCIDLLRQYRFYLANDGNVEFGIMHRTKDAHSEVFVKSFKYIQYWGKAKGRFLEVMNLFKLDNLPDMEFIDSWPVVTESLTTIHPQLDETKEWINQLIEEYNILAQT